MNRKKLVIEYTGVALIGDNLAVQVSYLCNKVYPEKPLKLSLV